MSCLILGSTSFAGSSLVNYLLSKDETVIGISRSEEPHPVMQPYFANANKKAFQFFPLDLNQHSEEIKKIILQYKPHYIIDFAGQGMVAESWNDPAQWYLTNIVSKVKLHQFLKDCDFIKRYIRVSTPEVYGDVKNKMQEDQGIAPSTPYAVSHAAIDMSLLAFYKQYQFPMILTRFANFYGPHQQLYRIIPRTIIYGLLGKKLPLQGGGITQRMFIFNDDISDGIYRVMQQGKLGDVYHFSNQPCLSIKALIQKICESLAIPFADVVEEAPERAGKDGIYDMDSTKSQVELGWKPTHTLEQGLEKTIRWVKDNIESIKTLPLNYIHKV